MPLRGPLFAPTLQGPLVGIRDPGSLPPVLPQTPEDEARIAKAQADEARAAWLRQNPQARQLAARLALEQTSSGQPRPEVEPEPERLALLPRYSEEEGLVAPEVVAGLERVGSMFGRASRGEHVDPEEPMNFAMNVTGGSLGARRPAGSVGMGGRVEASQLGAPEGMEAYKAYGPNGKPVTRYRPKGEGQRVREENAARRGTEEAGRFANIEADRAALAAEAPLQPTDKPRIEWPLEDAAPLAKQGHAQGERYLPGAPAHVRNVQQQTAIANDYLAGAARGAVGRDWYRKTQAYLNQTTGNLGGNRPGAQDVHTAVLGAYSPRASLEANRLASVRSAAQVATGEPIAAGMAPRNKAAQAAYESRIDNPSLKVDPFTRQMRGLPSLRAVHDTRQMQSLGFPLGKSPSEANHRWADMMMERMVERANEMKLGGFDDWTVDRLQAARWVAHKAEEEGVPVESLADAFAPIDEPLTANIYSEAIPSSELSDLVNMSEQQKREYTAEFLNAMSTREGQDAFSLQMGLETPPGAGQGYGEWQGNLNPNIRNRVLVDPEKGGTGRISQAGKTAVDFRAAISGLLGGQADTAFSYGRAAPTKAAENFAAVDLGRPSTGQDLIDYKAALAARGQPDVIANQRSGSAIELTNLGAGGKGWRQAVADTIAERGGTARTGYNSGGLTLGNTSAYKPSEWLTKLQNPTLRASVKQMLPQAAAKIERLAQQLPLTDAGRNVYLKTLEVLKASGLEGVEDAVKKGILPAVALAIVIRGGETDPQQALAETQDPRRSTAAGY